MPCRRYQPDHNGECLNCDEPAFAHGADEMAAHAIEAAARHLLATIDAVRRVQATRSDGLAFERAVEALRAALQ